MPSVLLPHGAASVPSSVCGASCGGHGRHTPMPCLALLSTVREVRRGTCERGTCEMGVWTQGCVLYLCGGKGRYTYVLALLYHTVVCE